MWWIAATVTGCKMYAMLDQYVSSRDLKQFTVTAVTTISGISFHKLTTLKLKRSTASSVSGSVLGPGVGV